MIKSLLVATFGLMLLAPAANAYEPNDSIWDLKYEISAVNDNFNVLRGNIHCYLNYSSGGQVLGDRCVISDSAYSSYVSYLGEYWPSVTPAPQVGQYTSNWFYGNGAVSQLISLRDQSRGRLAELRALRVSLEQERGNVDSQLTSEAQQAVAQAEAALAQAQANLATVDVRVEEATQELTAQINAVIGSRR